MTITSSVGLGTGLDISGIVQQLVSAEGAPATNSLDKRQTAAQTRLSALGSLKSALSAFQTAAAKLKNSTAFDSLTTTSSNSSILSASAGTGAVAGSYSIAVQKLAQSHKLIAGTGLASSSTSVGTGSLTIKSGTNTFTLNITAGVNDTLDGIRKAINDSSSNTGVSASIINTDAGAKLVLSSRNTGVANAITVTGSDDDGNNSDASGLSQLFYDPANTMGNGAAVTNLSQVTAAQDSVIEVDGETVTRSSNTVSDVISGVSLTLNAETTGTPVTLNVALDQTTITQTVNDFATAYNNLQKVLNNLGSYDPASKNAGPLLGDATLRSVESQLRRDLGAPVTSATSTSYTTLHSLGIEIDRNGTMSVKQSTLSSAVSGNLNALKDVFASADGIAVRVSDHLDNYLEAGGVLSQQTDSLNKTLSTISNQRLALQDRLARLQTTLLKQFTAMDTLVAGLNNTGSYLTKQLASLPGFTNK